MTQEKPKNAVFAMLKGEKFKEAMEGILKERTPQFVASCLALVSQNDKLSECDTGSLYGAILTAAALDLPINQSLGFAYIVPYRHKYKDEKGEWQSEMRAQFQAGYKAFIQLAIRSQQFKTMAVTEIYEGQIISKNPLTGFLFDFEKEVVKTPEKIVGYAAYFSLVNGFEKTMYLSKEDLRAHGSKFSESYKKGFGLWKDEFDAMAKKTVIKLLLSRFAPLSTDMQRAISVDQAVIAEGGTPEYIDRMGKEEVNEEHVRLTQYIESVQSIEGLEAVRSEAESAGSDIFEMFEKKLATISQKTL